MCGCVWVCGCGCGCGSVGVCAVHLRGVCHNLQCYVLVFVFVCVCVFVVNSSYPATAKGTIRCRMIMQRKWPKFTAKSAFMESATSPVWESIIIYLPFGKSRVSLRPSWRALWCLCRRSFPVRSTAHGHFTVKFRRGLRSI